MSRLATVDRTTNETRIRVTVDLDGSGHGEIESPIGFLSHMLEQIARHGALDVILAAEGDVHVDGHHTTEDLGLVLGRAVSDALGERRGIRRFGAATLPMDEARATAALDLSGRPFFVWEGRLPKARLGDFDTELVQVFFEAFARGAACNLHVRLEAGENLHHSVEVCFKAFARALRQAVELDPRSPDVPSTKGVLGG